MEALELFKRYMLFKTLPSEGGLLDQEEDWMFDLMLCLKGYAYAQWKRDHPDEAQLLEAPADLSGVQNWVDAING